MATVAIAANASAAKIVAGHDHPNVPLGFMS